MTKNQIEYAKLLEQKRYNEESIAAARERVRSEVGLGYEQLSESRRHNLMSESLDVQKTSEAVRHNKELEMLQRETLFETKRHSLATEDLNRSSLEESIRHNVAAETETTRSNIRKEQQNAESLAANLFQFSETMNMRNLELAEATRAHIANEELERMSIAQRRESATQNISLGYAQLSEQARHSRATETTAIRMADEEHRANVSRERETREHNTQIELLQTREIRELERHNVAVEQADESLKLSKTLESGARTMSIINTIAPLFKIR